MTCDLVSALGALFSALGLIHLLTLQERPCTRCIKRNIGHLCHDEPRDGVKKSKSEPENANGDDDGSKHEATPPEVPVNAINQPTTAPDAGLNLAPPPLPPNRGANAASIAQPTPVSAPQLPSLTAHNSSRKLHKPPALDGLHTEPS